MEASVLWESDHQGSNNTKNKTINREVEITESQSCARTGSHTRPGRIRGRGIKGANNYNNNKTFVYSNRIMIKRVVVMEGEPGNRVR